MAIYTPERLTVEEYLAWEENNFEKHEYIDGEVRCMAGANHRHNRIMMNSAIAIGRQLDDSPCSMLSSDMRVKVGAARYVYPDLSVICDEVMFERDNEMELLNPVLVVEVTSPSSIEYDRGDKRDFYFDVPSVQSYLVIDQHRVYADLYSRAEGGWLIEAFSALDDVIPLEFINCELPLTQVYRGIDMGEAQAG